MKLFTFIVAISASLAAQHSNKECMHLNNEFYTNSTIISKAYFEDKDIKTAVSLTRVNLNIAKDIYNKCSNEFWEELNRKYKEDNKTAEFWREDMRSYIIRAEKQLERYKDI